VLEKNSDRHARLDLTSKTENVRKEPILPNAALCNNYRFFAPGQKRDTIKGSFATGMWQKIIQRFRHQNRM